MAVTRAKRHVAVICDVECCASDAFIGRLLKHMEDRGEYRSALELDPGPETIAVTAAPEQQQQQQQQRQPDGVTVGGPSCSAATGGGGGGGGGGDGGGSGRGGRRQPRRQGAADGPSADERTTLSDDDVLARVHQFATGGKTTALSGSELELPAELTARQRALAHETAEGLGLGHASRGGLLRVLVLSRRGCTGEGAAARPAGAGATAAAVPERPTPEKSPMAGDTPDENDEDVDPKAAANPFAALTEGGKPRGDDSEDDGDENDATSVARGGGGSARGERGRELPAAPTSAAAATDEGTQVMTTIPPGPSKAAVAKNASPTDRAEPKSRQAGLAAGGLSLRSSSARGDLPSTILGESIDGINSCGSGLGTAETKADRSASPALTPSVASGGGRAESRNGLLASLHAERTARQPPAPPPSKGRKKGGKGKTGGAGAKGGGARAGGGLVHGGGYAHGDEDDWGVEIVLTAGGAAGGGGGKKHSSKKGASGTKKGRKKAGGGGGGGGGAAAGGKTVDGARGKVSNLTSRGGGVGEDDDGDDDDMAFLDAQIKVKRAAEPCYASLLRSTTEAMRKNNPRWAAAEDKGKPSKSVITGARRGQLQSALQTRLAEEEKKRAKASGDGKDEKKS